MTERLDKAGLTEFVNTVEAELAAIRSAMPTGGTPPPYAEIVALLTRIAVATESIDAKTKGPKQ